MRSAEETRHTWKRAENILENYTPEQNTSEGGLAKNAKVIPKIYYSPEYRGSCCWNLAIPKWTGVDFRHLAD